jgi:chitinase
MNSPNYFTRVLGTNGIGSRFNGNGGEEETFEYKDLPQAGTTEQVDRAVGAAFCIGGGGGFVSYDNPETVGMKASFVVEKRLGGIFYWTATADSTGPRSLIETGFRALHT